MPQVAAARDDVGGPRGLDEPRDPPRLVLSVAVDGHEDVVARVDRVRKRGANRRAVAAVDRMVDDADVLSPHEQFGRPVVRAIVDHQHVAAVAQRVIQHAADVVDLVVDGQCRQDSISHAPIIAPPGGKGKGAKSRAATDKPIRHPPYRLRLISSPAVLMILGLSGVGLPPVAASGQMLVAKRRTEAMTASRVGACLVSRRGTGRRRLDGCLAVLLAVSLFGTLARCEDASTPSPAARPPETPSFVSADPSRPVSLPDQVMSASRAAVLSAKVIGLLEEGNVEEALAADREYVSALETAAGKDDWRTTERTTLSDGIGAGCRVQRPTADDLFGPRVGKRSMPAEKWRSRSTARRRRCSARQLAGFTAVLGENTNSVAFALQNLGRIGLTQENPAKAREHFLRCQAVTKTLAGEDSTAYAAALNGLGCACLLAKDFDQAETHFREALHRLRRLHGSKSPIYLDVLGRLCYVLVEKRRLPEAEAMWLKRSTYCWRISSRTPRAWPRAY